MNDTFDMVRTVGEILAMLVIMVAALKWLFMGKANTDASVTLLNSNLQSSIQLVKTELGGKLDAVAKQLEKLEEKHAERERSSEEDGERLLSLEKDVENLLSSRGRISDRPPPRGRARRSRSRADK